MNNDKKPSSPPNLAGTNRRQVNWNTFDFKGEKGDGKGPQEGSFSWDEVGPIKQNTKNINWRLFSIVTFVLVCSILLVVLILT